MDNQAVINIVTALPCEAKPLIRHLQLQGRQAENGFRIYENKHRGLRLIISGLGRVNCAAACAYLRGLYPHEQNAWLNVGIGGHADLALGTPLIGHKIIDGTTAKAGAGARAWYPAILFKAPCRSGDITTLDAPCSDYQGESCYDMEAAAFYATASRFCSAELIHVFKVISDNRAAPHHQVNEADSQRLIEQNISSIDNIITALSALLRQYLTQAEIDISAFTDKWHFTVSQQHKLQRLLQKLTALNDSVDHLQLAQQKNSKAVIAALERQLQDLSVEYP